MTDVTTTAPVRRNPFALARRAGEAPPWALVVFAIVSVQIGASFAKGLFDVAGPAGVVFLRTLFAGIVFAVVWRPDVRRLRRSEVAPLLLYGVNIAAMMISFYAAINLVPLGVAVAISFVGPLALAVIGSRQAKDLLWVGCAALGILLLSPFTNGDLNPLGVALSLLSGVTWAAYVLLGRRVCAVPDSNAQLALAMLIAALVMLPFGIGGAVKVLAAPGLIFLALVVAVTSSAVPVALEFAALRSLPPRAFSLLLSLEPVAATVVGFVVLGEALGVRELSGILLVTVAAAATARST